MTGVVEGFRWALLGTPAPHSVMLLVSIGVSALMLVSGAFYFRRMERGFVDVI
jgi:lipopolysaccharide transport system permease protein